jgi:hypothetical protein
MIPEWSVSQYYCVYMCLQFVQRIVCQLSHLDYEKRSERVKLDSASQRISAPYFNKITAPFIRLPVSASLSREQKLKNIFFLICELGRAVRLANFWS